MGRQRRRNNTRSENIELDTDLPEISARDWDNMDEGVGSVRVVAKYDDEADIEEPPVSSGLTTEPRLAAPGPGTKYSAQHSVETSSRPDDLVTLYLLAKDEQLSGDRINSAAYANGLSFGKMNIFHRLDENQEPLYSMANMMEPGYFDPETIHQLKTRGLVMFIQLAYLKHSSEALHDMLRCAYRMAEMIGARLCNDKRQPLTEKDTTAYRQLAASFDAES
jgi:cell division protein ZipA